MCENEIRNKVDGLIRYVRTEMCWVSIEALRWSFDAFISCESISCGICWPDSDRLGIDTHVPRPIPFSAVTNINFGLTAQG